MSYVLYEVHLQNRKTASSCQYALHLMRMDCLTKIIVTDVDPLVHAEAIDPDQDDLAEQLSFNEDDATASVLSSLEDLDEAACDSVAADMAPDLAAESMPDLASGAGNYVAAGVAHDAAGPNEAAVLEGQDKGRYSMQQDGLPAMAGAQGDKPPEAPAGETRVMAGNEGLLEEWNAQTEQEGPLNADLAAASSAPEPLIVDDEQLGDSAPLTEALQDLRLKTQPEHPGAAELDADSAAALDEELLSLELDEDVSSALSISSISAPDEPLSISGAPSAAIDSSPKPSDQACAEPVDLGPSRGITAAVVHSAATAPLQISLQREARQPYQAQEGSGSAPHAEEHGELTQVMQSSDQAEALPSSTKRSEEVEPLPHHGERLALEQRYLPAQGAMLTSCKNSTAEVHLVEAADKAASEGSEKRETIASLVEHDPATSWRPAPVGSDTPTSARSTLPASSQHQDRLSATAGTPHPSLGNHKGLPNEPAAAADMAPTSPATARPRQDASESSRGGSSSALDFLAYGDALSQAEALERDLVTGEAYMMARGCGSCRR